jgi:hypothetical protein
MTTHSSRAGLRAVDDAADRLIDQLMDQLRDAARAEHDAAVVKVKAEFNADIAELRRELLAQLDETVTQVKAKYEKEVATLQRQLAEARGEVSKLQMLDAFATWERDKPTRLN